MSPKERAILCCLFFLFVSSIGNILLGSNWIFVGINHNLLFMAFFLAFQYKECFKKEEGVERYEVD